MKFLLALLFTLNAFAAFTPFPPSSPPADSITTKGGLLTSDGSAQAEFSPCADDEIIVWDSAQTLGFKCEAKPAGGGGITPTSSFVNYSLTNLTTSTEVTVASLAITTTRANQPVLVSFGENTANTFQGANVTPSNATCIVELRLGSTALVRYVYSGSGAKPIPSAVMIIPTAGANTINFRFRSGVSSGGSCSTFQSRMRVTLL